MSSSPAATAACMQASLATTPWSRRKSTAPARGGPRLHGLQQKSAQKQRYARAVRASNRASSCSVGAGVHRPQCAPWPASKQRWRVAALAGFSARDLSSAVAPPPCSPVWPAWPLVAPAERAVAARQAASEPPGAATEPTRHHKKGNCGAPPAASAAGNVADGPCPCAPRTAWSTSSHDPSTSSNAVAAICLRRRSPPSSSGPPNEGPTGAKTRDDAARARAPEASSSASSGALRPTPRRKRARREKWWQRRRGAPATRRVRARRRFRLRAGGPTCPHLLAPTPVRLAGLLSPRTALKSSAAPKAPKRLVAFRPWRSLLPLRCCSQAPLPHHGLGRGSRRSPALCRARAARRARARFSRLLFAPPFRAARRAPRTARACRRLARTS
jgi:hypothetical protein